jgi:gliding motility-associated-like protein
MSIANLNLNAQTQYTVIPAGGTAGTTNGTGADPVCRYFNSIRYQVVYTVAELTASGMPANTVISRLAWNVTESSASLGNYTIKMGHTASANSATDNVNATTTVKNAFTYGVALGWNDIIFDANFTWNGTQNIVVEICTGPSNPFTTPYGGVQAKTGITSGSRRYRVDGASACATNTNLTNTTKPYVRFTGAILSACSGTPNAGTSAISSSSGCASTSFNLSASGITSGTGITYQWQSSPTGLAGSWTSIGGATASTLTTSAPTTTYYRLVTTCTNSGLSANSSSVSYSVNTCSISLTLTDSFGDGWNGATMNLVVNGSTLATVGGGFTTGLSQVLSYCVPANSTYSLVYIGGGTYPGEVGVSMSVAGSTIYTVGAGLATVGATLTSGTACPPACSGAPTGGSATASVSSSCASVAFTVNNSGQSAGSGITYQWQSSPNGAGPWANVGASSSSYTALSTSLTASTYYQLLVTCTSSGLSSASSSTYVTLSSGGCTCLAYAPSNATSAADDEIFNVSLGTLNNSSTCATVAPGAGSVGNMYSNYTGNVAAPTLIQANTYPLSVTVGMCGGTAYTGAVAVFIDYNQNGSFADPGENVYVSPSTLFAVGGTAVTGNITIPNTALVGITRMRVVEIEFSTSPGATGTYTWGETEDYCVSIAAAAPCSGLPNAGVAAISQSNGCSGGSVNLTATGVSTGTGLTFQWQSSPTGLAGSWTNIVGANSTSYTITGSVGTTYYSLFSSCSASGLSNTSNTVSFTGISCASNIVPFSGSTVIPCGTSGYLYDNGGAAGNYATSSNGYTVLENSGNAVITLSGTYSGIEAGFDYLRIYNGVGTGGTIIGGPYSNSAGGTITPITTAPGQTITISFTSDGSVEYGGFELTAIYSGVCGPANLSSITSSPSSICNGQSTTLTANGVVGTVYWFAGSCGTSGQIATGNTLTVSPTTTTTYFARNFNAGQWSSACVSSTVTVLDLPSVNAGIDQFICPATTATLNGTASFVSTTTSSIQTTTVGGNGCTGGAMFDITAGANPITISGFGLVPEITGIQNVNVYYKTGTYSGFETTAGSWTFVGTYSINGVAGVQSTITTSSIVIPATALYGIYLNYDAQYTNGANTYSNADLTLTTGTGLCGLFATTNIPRTFNGTVYYGSPAPGTPAVSWTPSSTLSNATILNPVASPTSTTTYTITATASNGCTASDAVLITVQDLVNPTISAPAAVSVVADAGFCNASGVVLGTPTTSDNCSVASVVSNAPATFPLGNTTVTWTVTDGSSNTAIATQTVTVTDNQNPTITAPLAVTVNADASSCNATGVALGTPTTTDNCSVASVVSNAPATFPLGNTTVTWTVTDGSSNTAIATQTVTVTDNQNPTITAPLAVTVNADASSCNATGVVLGTPTTSDNCSVAGFVNDAPASYPLGSTTVTWTVTDGSGNTSTSTQTVTVLDNQNPSITAPLAVTVNADASSCNATGVVLGTPTTSDNCSVAGFVNDGPASYPLGNTTVTWTVTDGSGNTSTSTQTVTVTDNQNPTITAPITVTVSSDPGICSASGVNLGLPTTTDNCSVAGYSNDGLSVYPLGNTTVTWTVTDGSGNTSTAVQTVTVVDNENPSPICQNVTIQLDAIGNATLTAAQVNNGSFDNCGIASLVVSQTTFDCSHVGLNPVTLAVTDNSGNVSTCSSIITVEDNVAPIALCQNLTLPLDNSGNVTITPSQINNGSSDNCGIASLSLSQTSFDCLNVGSNNVVLTLIDVNGNSSTCSSVFTITDSNNPVFVYVPANISENAVSNLCGRVITYDLPVFDDNCGVTMSQTDLSGLTTGDIFPVGLTTQTYSVTDNSGNTISASFTITIVDDQVPVITNCPANISVNSSSSNCGSTVTWTPPAISDNCPGVQYSESHSSGDFFPIGVTTVSYNATDVSGNISTCSFTITVVDNISPVIPTLATLTGACSVTATAPSTTDNCGGTVVGSTINPLTYSAQGTYTITWNFTDGSGNTSSANQTVVVLDNVAPTITAPVAVSVSANASCNATGVILGSPVTFDNCSVVSTSNNAPTTFPIGTTTITWTATDAAGNSATASQQVTVTDNIVPTISAPASITVPANASCVAYNVNLGNPIATDNCTLASVVNNGPAIYPLGATVVTWTATDISGNTATSIQTITVSDQALPIIVSPGNLTLSASISCSVLNASVLGNPFSAGNVYTSDNCTVAGISNNAPTSFPIGNTDVIWTVVDINGNTASATQIITVVDNINPTIAAPALVSENANAACAATGVVLGTPITTDNCSVVSTTNNAPSSYPIGTTIVTWTVTDASGNVASANQTVTISDNQNPTITAPGTINTTTNNSCMALNVNLGTPATADNCSVASVTNNAPSAFNVGTTAVIWTVTDGSGNTATTTQNVVVTDVEDPIIIAPSTITANTTAACAASGITLGNATAIDNCSIATVVNNAPSTFPVGTTTVTWTATDVNGNTATATQLVVVSDVVNPSITPPADIVTVTNSGCTAAGLNLGVPVTSDNCGVASVYNDAPAAFSVGMTYITWTVIDVNGNSSTTIQKITVTDDSNPTLTLGANVTVDANNSCVAFNVDLGTPVVSDNCGIASLVNDAPTVYNLGTTTIIWVATDNNGNTVSATQTVTVNDNTAPVVLAPASLNISTNNGCVASGVILGNPLVTDNCTVASIVNNAPIDFPVGTTVVTYTATDASGNTTTATQNVVVTDAINPTPVLQNITVTLDNQGNTTVSFADVDNGSFDNCGIASTTLSQTEFDCSNVGMNVLTVTITDNNNNTTVANITVNVQTNGVDSDLDGVDDSCDGIPDSVDPLIPEAFTPNGNGVNDYFVIGKSEVFTEKRLDVFNRYGNSVYSSENYQNDWDGTRTDNGQALPDGTYYYILTLDGNNIYKGFVYINRVKQ